MAITTNAVLVDKFIDVFKEAGIKSVNVSLDSLDEDSFNKISRRNYFKEIKANIDLLIENDCLSVLVFAKIFFELYTRFVYKNEILIISQKTWHP